MNVATITLKKSNLFSGIIQDYVSQSPKLTDFYGLAPTLDGFNQYLSKKSFDQNKRNILSEHFEKQYESNGISPSPEVLSNIQKLKDANTFTVTTGHQLNLFTGPLYFIYKIGSIIQLAKQLNDAHPDKHIVPIYWMASEDHDFEEIQHFRLFKKKHIWQTEQQGAVGRMLSDGMSELFSDIPDLPELFQKAYAKGNSLSKATMMIVNTLFEKYGVICLDSDSKSLKSIFGPVIKEELLNHPSFEAVNKTSESLQEAGYKAQVNAREINLFYLDNGVRKRIIKEENQFIVLNTELRFSESELLQLVDDSPEKFSPNVILRPVYQECILPNLAYVGGPGETHYWLQLKTTFDHFNIDFPILVPRDFILYMTKGMQKKADKLGLTTEDLFRPYQELKKQINDANSNSDAILDEAKRGLEAVFSKLGDKIPEEGTKRQIEAQKQNTLNQFKKVEGKINKYFDSVNETAIRQLDTIKEFAFPNGAPQERTDNVLNFLINNPNFVDEVVSICDPFKIEYKILYQD